MSHQGKVALLAAYRFIRATKKTRVINIITGISILGVIIGVTTIVVVLSVLNGFRKLATDLFLVVDSDVQLIATRGALMSVSDTLLLELKRLPSVASAHRFVEGKVLMITERQSGVVSLKGIEQSAYKRMARFLDAGYEPLDNQSLAVGIGLAQKFTATYKTEACLLSPRAIDDGLDALQRGIMASAPELPVLKVQNYFSAHRAYDDAYVLAALPITQRIFRLSPADISGVDIYAAAGIDNETLKKHVQTWLSEKKLNDRYAVQSLSDKYEELFRVMKLEKWGSFIILMLIIIVASMSLIGSLTMTAIEKKQDVYFLYCIGMTKQSIEKIFLLEGLLIGVIGTAIGIGLGWLICTAQQTFGVVPLPYGDAFIIKAYPVAIERDDFLIAAAAAVGIAVLASIYPAKKAATVLDRAARK